MRIFLIFLLAPMAFAQSSVSWLRFLNSSGTAWTQLQSPPTLGANHTITWPVPTGTAGCWLDNGSGVTSIGPCGSSTGPGCTIVLTSVPGGDLGAQITTDLATPPPGCASTSEVIIDIPGTTNMSTGIVLSSNQSVQCQSYATIINWTGGSAVAIAFGTGSSVVNGAVWEGCSFNGAGSGTLFLMRNLAIQDNFIIQPNIGFTGGSGFATAIQVGESGGSTYNNAILYPRIALNPANLSVGQVGIDIVHNGHATQVVHPVIQDNNSNSAGSVCARVNESSNVVFTGGGNIQGCGVDVAIGTSGSIAAFNTKVDGIYMGPGNSSSNVDIEFGAGSIDATESAYHEGGYSQTCVDKIDNGSFNTMIVGSSFVSSANAICPLGVNNNTTWSMELPYFGSGVSPYTSYPSVPYGLQNWTDASGENQLPHANLTIGPNRHIISPQFVSSSSNPASSAAWSVALANSDVVEWRNHANTGDVGVGFNTADQFSFNNTGSWANPVMLVPSVGVQWQYATGSLVTYANSNGNFEVNGGGLYVTGAGELGSNLTVDSNAYAQKFQMPDNYGGCIYSPPLNQSCGSYSVDAEIVPYPTYNHVYFKDSTGVTNMEIIAAYSPSLYTPQINMYLPLAVGTYSVPRDLTLSGSLKNPAGTTILDNSLNLNVNTTATNSLFIGAGGCSGTCGVTSLAAGTGLSVSSSTGSVTVSNSAPYVAPAAGTGISVSGNVITNSAPFPGCTFTTSPALCTNATCTTTTTLTYASSCP